MPRLIATSTLLLALLVPTVGFAQTSPSALPSSPDQIEPANIVEPQAFVDKATASNNFEIQSSQLALTMSQNADVKAFAQMMIDDHTKAGADMQAAAQAQGITPPATPDADTAGKLQQLQAVSGADFDKLYVQLQTDAHVAAVALFSGYAQGGPAGPLKDFANATLPTLKKHYEHVLTLPH